MSVIISILASILVFGAVIFVHELGHFLAAKWSKIKVNEFNMGMGPKLFGFQRGETSYNLRLLPIGGSCVMEGEDDESDDSRSFTRARLSRRILVIVAGAVMNLILGFSILIGITSSQRAIATRTVAQFSEGAKTEATGLAVNDTILAVNGRNLFVYDDLFYELYRVQDGKADVLVLRDGQKVLLKDVQFTTRYDEESGLNILIFDFKVWGIKKTVGSVLKESALQTVSMARQIFLSLVDLVTGRIPINQLSGPVGIVTEISKAANENFLTLLMIMAFITINLGVFNLLPLPALDGGRLVFLLFEAVTKKKMPVKYEAMVHFAGLIMLFALMIFVTYQDVTKLFVK